jgi:hypothetical protein
MLLSYDQKIANGNLWFQQCANYFVQCSRFKNMTNSTHNSVGTDLQTLYDAYNGRFPEKWFKHVTDPYKNNSQYPAKLRPVSIIRTNLDQLISEFNRRPLRFMVVNSSPEGYDSYNEQMTQTLQGNVQQHFNEAIKALGVTQPQEGEEPKEIPLPESLKKQFQSSWRDQLAIMGQYWLEDALDIYHVKETLLRMFKHWIIAGEAYSFKGVYNGNFYYRDISPMDIDFARSQHKVFVEDADWVVARYMMSISDIVTMFYGEVASDKMKKLADPSQYTPDTFFTAFGGNNQALTTQYGGLMPVYHVQWTAQKQVLVIEYVDPQTGLPTQMEVDEDYKVSEGETIVERNWVNEKYETWRLDQETFAFMQPVAVQRTNGGIISSCKNGYNGRTYSDLHSKNTSVMEIGMPFQLMCMIINWKIEFMIAKSKGKIALIDKNVIPRDNGWNDDKFFHYAESKGWGLINRNQVGVDKSYNQYQVLDMSMYDNIKQLIDLYQYYKQQWDEILGMSPQRKGQMTGTDDLVGTTQNSVFQSTVITDMIFVNFEQLMLRDFEGMLDMSRYVIAAEGEFKKIRYNTDETYELVKITPEHYCMHALGIKLSMSSKDFEVLNTMKAQAANFIQAGVQASTILKTLTADNLSKLEQDLKAIEAMQSENAQAQQNNEHDLLATENEMKKDFEAFKAQLQGDLLEKEWDRKDNNEMIKGDFATYTFQDGDSNDNGVPDAAEVMERAQKRAIELQKDSTERMRIHSENIRHAKDLKLKEKEIATKSADTRYKARQSKAKKK